MRHGIWQHGDTLQHSRTQHWFFRLLLALLFNYVFIKSIHSFAYLNITGSQPLQSPSSHCSIAVCKQCIRMVKRNLINRKHVGLDPTWVLQSVTSSLYILCINYLQDMGLQMSMTLSYWIIQKKTTLCLSIQLMYLPQDAAYQRTAYNWLF